MHRRSIELVLAGTLGGFLAGCASSTRVASLPPYSSPESVFVQQSGAADGHPAAATEGGHYANHVAVAAGEFYSSDENGVRIGLEYEHRIDTLPGFLENKFGIGLLLDFDSPPVEAGLIAVPLAYRPYEPVSLLIAPGFVYFSDQPNTVAIRLGMKYEFPLLDRFTFGPEFYYDILDGGRRKGVLALALGVGF